MKLQTKISLGLLPLIILSFYLLSLWSIKTATSGIRESSFDHLEASLETFYANELVKPQSILKENNLDQFESFRSDYQEKAIKTLSEKNVSEEGMHVVIVSKSAEVIYCSEDRAVNELRVIIFPQIQKTIASSGSFLRGHIDDKGYEHEIYVSRYFEPWDFVVFFVKSDRIAHDSINQLRIATFSVAGLCALGSFLLIFILFRQFLHSPIKKLTEASRSIAKQKTVKSISVYSTDELGELARSMEEMSSDISTYQQSLLDMQDSLEHKVRERTEDLNNTNEQLVHENERRKQVEKKLKANEQKYLQMFLDNKAIKLLIEPSSGDIVEANDAACDFYQYSKDKLLSLNITDINMLPANKIQEEMENAKEQRRSYFIFPHKISTGETKDVEVYSGPINVDGNTLLFSIIHDVSERKKLEEQLRQATKMQAVGTLAGGIAHEFNNLLGVIMGCADMARDEVQQDSFAKTQLDKVMKASYRVKDLVKQILTFSRQSQQQLISANLCLHVKESVE
jgi:PAS domain S-box-containing protein